MTPISHALPEEPPPPRTSARPEREEEFVFMGVAFREA
jgi:hypothetical protein